MDSELQHLLPHGDRRHFAFLRAALDPSDPRLRAGELGSDQGPRQGIHDRIPRARDAHGRDVLRPRLRRVLHVLRGRAAPDVPHHRRVGRSAPGVCGLQVLSLHAARLRAHAARDPRGLFPDRLDRYPGGTRLSFPARDADLALARLLRLLRRQGADVAGAYLAARRARGGADGGIGHARGRASEDGRLRLPALLAADAARGLAPLHAVHLHPQRCRRRSTPRSWRWRRRT